MNKLLAVLTVSAAVLAAAIPALLSGCSGGSSGSGGNTITILWADWAPARALQKLSEDYTAATGTKVKVEMKDWSAISGTKNTEFANNGTTYDLIIGDSQWVGQGVVGKHYLELTDFVKANPELFKDVSPAALQYYGEYPKGSGRYYGVPCEADAMAFAYRKDLFEDPKHKEGFKKWLSGMDQAYSLNYQLEVPKTWDHLLLIARYFKEASGEKDMAGIVMPTTTGYDQATMSFECLLWAFGGDWGDQSKYTVTIDSPQSIAALGFFKQLANASSPGITNMDYPQVTSAYTGGRAAMAMTFFAFMPDFASKKTNNDYWDKTGYFNVPAGPKGRFTALGGQGLSVNAHIDNARQQRALDFVKWFSKPETQAKWASAGGYSANNTVLASDAFKQAAPYNPLFQEAFGMMRDFWNIPQYDPLLQSSQKHISQVLQDRETPEQAIKAIQSEQEAVMKQAGLLK